MVKTAETKINGIKKAELIVVCLGRTDRLTRLQLEICGELWVAGVSTFLSNHELNSIQDEILNSWRLGNNQDLRQITL